MDTWTKTCGSIPGGFIFTHILSAEVASATLRMNSAVLFQARWPEENAEGSLRSLTSWLKQHCPPQKM